MEAMEVLTEMLVAHTAQDAENFKALDEKLDATNAKLDALTTELARYRGFSGGIIWFVTVVFAVVAAFGHDILLWIRG